VNGKEGNQDISVCTRATRLMRTVMSVTRATTHRNHGVGDVLMTLTVYIENECESHFVHDTKKDVNNKGLNHIESEVFVCIDEQSADTLCRSCAHRQG